MSSSRTSGGTSHILPREREGASFDVQTIRNVIGGTRSDIANQFQHLFDPKIFDASADDFLSYEALFEKQLLRAASAVNIIRDNPDLMRQHKARKVGMRDLFRTGALGIHYIAFLPFLKTQANAEQKKAWLNGAINAEYWGAYAQTELGHGSNVRALETTATYDKETDEFVIDSPTLTSTKWWPTAMYACTHGVVFAQLMIEGVSQGVFGFMLQFRDDNGDLMPGVEVGEIGPKLAQGETNIGYARFDHVRVPRFNMFSKHSKVTREGKFIAAPKKLSKFKYIGMMNIRVGMVSMAASVCGMAATIGVRYSCVRHQGFKKSKASDALVSGENAIIEYKNQQYRLFKCLGTSYLMLWSGRSIHNYLTRVVKGVMAGDDKAADELPELHATCAGLKAICTTMAAACVEDVRKLCGGQGYLRSSGIADLSASYVGNVTAEGEAVILALQTARFLIKTVQQVRAGETLAGSVSYIAAAPIKVPADMTSSAAFMSNRALILSLLADRSRRVATDLTEDFEAALAAGGDFDTALNSVAVLAWHAAECHSVYTMARNASEALPRFIKDDAARAALYRLHDLTLLQILREQGSDFLDILSGKQMRLILQAINTLLDQVRPDAVALTDAFGFRDQILNSTLGRFDGNVYEAILSEARASPLNQGTKMKGWHHLAGVVDLDFMRAGMKTQRQGSKL